MCWSSNHSPHLLLFIIPVFEKSKLRCYCPGFANRSSIMWTVHSYVICDDNGKIYWRVVSLSISNHSNKVLTIMVCSFYERKIMTYCVRLLIPLFLAGTSFAYTRIYLVIWKLIRSESSPAGANEENQRKKILRAKRHVTSCFLIVLSFLVLLFPLILGPLLLTIDSFDHAVYLTWSITLVILNSTVNSLIFFWTKTLLRKEALKMLKSLCF